jgi:hypothetical protein
MAAIVTNAKEAADVEEPHPHDPYPWARGNGLILLRSFVFEQLSTPQSTLSTKTEIPAMREYCDWIMTGAEPVAPLPATKLKAV